MPTPWQWTAAPYHVSLASEAYFARLASNERVEQAAGGSSARTQVSFAKTGRESPWPVRPAENARRHGESEVFTPGPTSRRLRLDLRVDNKDKASHAWRALTARADV